MAIVKLFGGLRRHVQTPELEVQGVTVREVLTALCAGNEGLRAAIFDGQVLHPYVRVMIAGRDIELDQGLDTPLAENDQLAVFPPIAGGRGTGKPDQKASLMDGLSGNNCVL